MKGFFFQWAPTKKPDKTTENELQQNWEYESKNTLWPIKAKWLRITQDIKKSLHVFGKVEAYDLEISLPNSSESNIFNLLFGNLKVTHELMNDAHSNPKLLNYFCQIRMELKGTWTVVISEISKCNKKCGNSQKIRIPQNILTRLNPKKIQHLVLSGLIDKVQFLWWDFRLYPKISPLSRWFL